MGLEHWFNSLDNREKLAIRHAVDYAKLYAGSGATGHSQFLLISKMAKLLDEREHAILAAQGRVVVQQIVWSSSDECWRDVLTGIRVEINDRYATSYRDISGSVEDIKSDH